MDMDLKAGSWIVGLLDYARKSFIQQSINPLPHLFTAPFVFSVVEI
jgi:hypothetical protein